MECCLGLVEGHGLHEYSGSRSGLDSPPELDIDCWGVKVKNMVMICLAESDGEPPVDVIMIMKNKDCVGAKELLQEATRWCVGA